MTAEEYYQKGNEYRKQQQWHEAINCYIQAIALDPDSPAVEAKRMLDDIMDFYCKEKKKKKKVTICQFYGQKFVYLLVYCYLCSRFQR